MTNKLNLPALFLTRLEKIIPAEKWEKVRDSFSYPKPVSFRLLSSPHDLRRGSASQDSSLTPCGNDEFIVEAMPWCDGAFVLKNKSLRELQETEAYKQNKIYVQGLSSMLPVWALDPKPGETVLDLCAAPGSKATQMAHLMKGEGRLVANEKNRERFFKMKSIIESYIGKEKVELSLRPGEMFGRNLSNTFDKILVDAPCSSEGRFRPDEPKTYKYWKPAKIKEMSRLQKNLLASAIHAAKPGGKIVYSTCTFSPEENEAVLDWALKKYSGEIEIESVPLDFLLNKTEGLISWEGKNFNHAVKRAVRIFPNEEMEGFFLAAIVKQRN